MPVSFYVPGSCSLPKSAFPRRAAWAFRRRQLCHLDKKRKKRENGEKGLDDSTVSVWSSLRPTLRRPRAGLFLLVILLSLSNWRTGSSRCCQRRPSLDCKRHTYYHLFIKHWFPACPSWAARVLKRNAEDQWHLAFVFFERRRVRAVIERRCANLQTSMWWERSEM